jgi:hypothetical protein
VESAAIESGSLDAPKCLQVLKVQLLVPKTNTTMVFWTLMRTPNFLVSNAAVSMSLLRLQVKISVMALQSGPVSTATKTFVTGLS